MRILTAYVLAQLTKVFLFSLLALTLLLVIGGVVREAIAQSLPPAQVFRLVPYLLPEMLRITIPVTLLLATTTVYSRMSSSNEVLAIKSLGISPMVIIWPAVTLAFLLSLATVWLNDLAVSWGRRGAQRVVVEAVEEIAYGMLRTHKRYSSPIFSINVKRVDDRRLILPTLSLKKRGSTPAITLRAEEAELSSDRQGDTLKIIAHNGRIEFEGKATIDFPGEYGLEIPLHDASRASGSAASPSAQPLSVIREETVRHEADIRSHEHRLAALAIHQMLSGDFDSLAARQWNGRRSELDGMRRQLYKMRTEPYRRWSAGFSCLCFFWVGAPMAIRRPGGDLLTSFFLCFLPILIVYYPFLAYTIDGSKSGTIPPISVWTGNVVLLAWGGYLLRRVIRY